MTAHTALAQRGAVKKTKKTSNFSRWGRNISQTKLSMVIEEVCAIFTHPRHFVTDVQF